MRLDSFSRVSLMAFPTRLERRVPGYLAMDAA
jgi:hypothetical protein